MADFIASWEPGWEVDLASRRPGSTSCSGNQTKRVCIPLAWPVQKQTTNQTLKLQTGRGRRRGSPATSPEILRPVRFLSPGSRACRLGTRAALPGASIHSSREKTGIRCRSRARLLPPARAPAPSSSAPAGGSRRRAAPPTIHRRRPTAHLPIQLCYRPRRRPPATGYPALPGRRRSRAASPPPAEPPPPPGRHRRRPPPLSPVVMELPPTHSNPGTISSAAALRHPGRR